MNVYIASYWGDIELKAQGDGTLVSWHDLTTAERAALSKLLKPTRVPEGNGSGSLVLDFSLSKAHGILAKGLKKSPLTAVMFSGGELKQVYDLSAVSDATKAVTVERPKPHDCPMPTPTKEKEARARRILTEFLSEEQLVAYKRQGSFIARGCHTGNLYRICSRWSELVSRFGRIFDINAQRVVCAVPDHRMPPSEESLSLKLAVELDELRFLHGEV